MHTLSTRTLSALAYERGEEYDPSQPPAFHRTVVCTAPSPMRAAHRDSGTPRSRKRRSNRPSANPVLPGRSGRAAPTDSTPAILNFGKARTAS